MSKINPKLSQTPEEAYAKMKHRRKVVKIQSTLEMFFPSNEC